MNNKLTISASPHVYGSVDTAKMMYGALLALLPAMIASIVLFRWQAAILMLACMFTCALTEVVLKKARGKEVAINDGSALLTGVLLAMALPPGLPVWMAVLGSVFAIAIGKEIFGSLGQNIFNPALLGRAFISAAFAADISVYHAPYTALSVDSVAGMDTVATATPLGLMKFQGVQTGLEQLFQGNVAGSVGETSALLLLLGGIFLVVKKYADWRIPAAYVACVFVLGEIVHQLSPAKFPGGVFHLLAGGMMLGAFFMATDPVTSPVTKLGKWVFGIGCGIFTIVIRCWGGQPEGVMYAILLMNGMTPVINILTRPKRYGT